MSHPKAVAIIESPASYVLRANMIGHGVAAEHDAPTIQSADAKKDVRVFAYASDAPEIVPEPT
jgi:hypothetical protein